MGDDVGQCLELEVVEDDGHVVAGQDDVLLQVVRAEAVGEDLGGHAVFGQVAAGAAVRNDDRPAWHGHSPYAGPRRARTKTDGSG